MRDTRVIPYRPAHMRALCVQPAQAAAAAVLMRPGYAEALARGPAWTLTVDGAPAGCGGLQPQWPGRALAWTLIGREAPASAWPRIVRHMTAVIDQAHRAGTRRIDATCLCDWPPGVRLLKLLGFEIEGKARAFDPLGNDHFLFAHIRET